LVADLNPGQGPAIEAIEEDLDPEIVTEEADQDATNHSTCIGNTSTN